LPQGSAFDSNEEAMYNPVSLATRSHLLERTTDMLNIRLPRVARLLAVPALLLLLIAAIGFELRPGGQAAPSVHANASGSATVKDLHALFFVWASGTPAVQQLAAQTCAGLHFPTGQCAQVSAVVRAGWLAMAASDPSAVGRPSIRPNLAARSQVLAHLSAQLASATGGRIANLLAATDQDYAEISRPEWIRAHVTGGRVLVAGTALVWATSYTQSSLPAGLNPKRSPYVALPDAYVKYANWGNISSIPSFYQPYYAPAGTTTHWTVNIATANGAHSVTNVLVTDVGPWNEDDNWWDTNGTSTTLPASCPVSTNLIAPDATSNALVDGICPNGANLRRIYYYLLYQHDGLPFFQAGGYAPSGSFSDGSAWPTALGLYCSEAAAASVNNDGIACYSGSTAYNANHGGWLRGGTYDSPVLNQSSVDLSPAVNKALGWVYPSSGLVQVNVSGLP
jgi:hypothetical protein